MQPAISFKSVLKLDAFANILIKRRRSQISKFLLICGFMASSGSVALAQALGDTDPDIDTTQPFCQGMQKQNVKVDGVMVKRFSISETKYLSCLKQGEPQAPWIVKKIAWEPQDQIDWENFVHQFGMALERGACNSVDSCMISQANSFRDQLDMSAYYYSDCAKFPMFLRQYFSFRKGLPFSFVDRLRANPLTPDQQAQQDLALQKAQDLGDDEVAKLQAKIADIRYSRNGNSPIHRFAVPSQNGTQPVDFFESMNTLLWRYNSGDYRMLISQSDLLPDFYSPRIDSHSIRPGTVVYNVAGHVALVYDIRPDGKVMTINAAPGNYLAARPMDREFSQSIPAHGAGFKNWRPLMIPNPVFGSGRYSQSIVGGQIAFVPDEKIADISYDQYFGNQKDPGGDWRRGKFIVGNRQVSWFEYIKLQVTNGSFRLDPLADFASNLASLCAALQDRVSHVAEASQPHDGGPVAQHPHPLNLPANIYGADGDWESYSTPGGDLRIRSQVLQIIQDLQNYKRQFLLKSPAFNYQGNNLKNDLLSVFARADQSCQITYVNSQGANVTIPTLSTAVLRLPLDSYDPYDCPELRWGAQQTSELKSCTNDETKMEWYNFQQFLRNATDRDSNAVMGWDLLSLQQVSGRQDNKVHAEKFDILKAVQSL